MALSNEELYGTFDPASREWRDGVLASLMRDACCDESSDQKWVVFDGPVDTLWIESMNTLLDDNKLLTLLSGGCGQARAGLAARVIDCVCGDCDAPAPTPLPPPFPSPVCLRR